MLERRRAAWSSSHWYVSIAADEDAAPLLAYVLLPVVEAVAAAALLPDFAVVAGLAAFEVLLAAALVVGLVAAACAELIGWLPVKTTLLEGF